MMPKSTVNCLKSKAQYSSTVKTYRVREDIEMQDFYLNQNQVFFKDYFVSNIGLGIKTTNTFLENRSVFLQSMVFLHLCHLSFFLPLCTFSPPLADSFHRFLSSSCGLARPPP